MLSEVFLCVFVALVSQGLVMQSAWSFGSAPSRDKIPSFVWDEVSQSCINRRGHRGRNQEFIGECGDLRTLCIAADLTELLGESVAFSGADLSHCFGDSLDLEGLRLNNSLLNESSFRRSRLPSADFRNSKISGSDFSSAILPRSDFSGVDGRDANFSHAFLESSNFKGAYLIRAKFLSANLNKAELSRADLRWSELRNANLNANLEYADLRETNLLGADLEHASISGTRFRGAFYDENTRLPFGCFTARKLGMVWAGLRTRICASHPEWIEVRLSNDFQRTYPWIREVRVTSDGARIRALVRSEMKVVRPDLSELNDKKPFIQTEIMCVAKPVLCERNRLKLLNKWRIVTFPSMGGSSLRLYHSLLRKSLNFPIRAVLPFEIKVVSQIPYRGKDDALKDLKVEAARELHSKRFALQSRPEVEYLTGFGEADVIPVALEGEPSNLVQTRLFCENQFLGDGFERSSLLCFLFAKTTDAVVWPAWIQRHVSKLSVRVELPGISNGRLEFGTQAMELQALLHKDLQRNSFFESWWERLW